MAKILCVDDDAAVLSALAKMLTRLGHEARPVGGVLEAMQVLGMESVDLVLTDWAMPSLTGMDLLELLKDSGNETPVVMLTAFGSIEHAVAAVKAGAVNYLTKPFTSEQVELAIVQALAVAQLRAENSALLRQTAEHRTGHEIIGESRAVRQVLDAVAAAAATRATVLLQGESGTGKELLARAVHEQSDRRRGDFVRINCAALPEGLIESTLFGHERGAFTGAFKRTIGAFERAHRGTLLLDEISEMRLDLQPKLLRVIQEREFERVGGTHTIQTDVRLVATTNRNLAQCVADGTFRQDLYYRLSVFPIMVPPLRERREDIPLLAFRFASRAAAEAGKPFSGIAIDALELLRAHDWPGNVRELQHAVERAVILAGGPTLETQHFAALVPGGMRRPAGTAGHGGGAVAALPPRSLDLAELERDAIAQALRVCDGNRTRAAELLGIDIRTLRRKLNAGTPDEAT